MAESKIEQELLKATGTKTKRNENRQAYLTRVMKAVAVLDDDVWEGLATEAQEWNNGAAEAHKAGDAIADFPDYEELDDNPRPDRNAISDAEEEEEEAVPVKAEAKKAPGRPVGGGGSRKTSACHTIKKIVAKKPTISVSELSEKLKADGLKVSDVTIATLRSDFRDSLRVLNELGMGSFTL